METINLEHHIEAVLFYKAEPIRKDELAKFFGVEREAVDTAVINLKGRLNGGIDIILTDEEVQLVTAPDVSETITRLKKEEMSREIGKAGAETLAIILYRGPITRAQIDLIRGVNSAFILRNLLMRRLVERIPHPQDKRQYQYQITTELLAHLGITKKEDLPEYKRIADELDQYEKEQEETQSTSTTFSSSNT